MTSKQRFLAVLDGGVPDRLPVTTHHVMPSFLNHCLDGIDTQAFFDRIGLDPILWANHTMPNAARGEFRDDDLGGLIVSDEWRVTCHELSGGEYPSRRFEIVTPKGALTLTLQNNEHTTWRLDTLVKKKKDVDLIAEFCTMPLCNVDAVNRTASGFGERGLLRGTLPCFELFGQPGCWQDAACLVGIERLIIESFEDPHWVHELLGILQRRKLDYIQSMQGARYDLCELGGGDASSTVISPLIFDEFVAPYDAGLIHAAHEAGQRIVYHTCGGMMPILEEIAAMKPNAMETFTPPGMGGDANLAEAKRRIGDRVCMIGGFDQFHFFKDCTPGQTRAEVRRCFDEAGTGGGYILSPSDHFFDADIACLEAYADEAHLCTY